MKPFREWTAADVAAHEARVRKPKEVMPHATAGGSVERTTQAVDVTPGAAQSGQNTRQFVIHIDPCPAPRMTKRDAYRVTTQYPRRPCVRRYFDFKDAVQRAVGDIPIVPDELHCTFHFPMPESWSNKKRSEQHGQPHRQRPDGDNCIKAIQDAMFLEDGGVWKVSYEKRWSEQGRVEVTMIWR